jgi:hypothetical protein
VEKFDNTQSSTYYLIGSSEARHADPWEIVPQILLVAAREQEENRVPPASEI